MIRKWSGYTAFLLLANVLLSGYGCKHKGAGGSAEGKVVYEISYPDTIKQGPMAAMLPKEMTLYFKDDKTNAEFKMGMGLIVTSFMSDAGEKKFSTLFKGFGKKSAMILDEESVKKNFIDRVDLKLVETGATKDVAGIKCREVNVTDSTDNTYQIYYTEDINLESPNWCTPYRDIDGVMLEYCVKVNNMVMNLKAKSVVFEKVDSTVFIVPPDYEIITDPKQFRPF